MTQEETAQVMAYIAKLQADHEAKIAAARMAFVVVHAEREKIIAGMLEIQRMATSKQPATVECLKRDVLAVIDYFCRDFDIPF